MNRAVLRDKKTMLGLIASVLLSIGAVFLAANDSSYWVVAAVIALIVLFFSVAKADKMTKQNL